MTICVTINAETPAELHAKVLGLIGRSAADVPNFPRPSEPKMEPFVPASVAAPIDNTAKAVVEPTSTEEPATAEVVPLAEKRKPGRLATKKAETVIDAEPAVAPVEPVKPVTSEDARKALDKVKDIAGLDAAREISKKHEPGVKLGDKTPASWTAIIQACEAFVAAAKE